MKRLVLAPTLISVLLFSAGAGARFVNLTEANPFHHVWMCEGDVSPDRRYRTTHNSNTLSGEQYGICGRYNLPLLKRKRL